MLKISLFLVNYYRLLSLAAQPFLKNPASVLSSAETVEAFHHILLAIWTLTEKSKGKLNKGKELSVKFDYKYWQNFWSEIEKELKNSPTADLAQKIELFDKFDQNMAILCKITWFASPFLPNPYNKDHMTVINRLYKKFLPHSDTNKSGK